MKKTMLMLAAGLALLATPVFADFSGEFTTARAEAVKASTATDMEVLQTHLHRAINCLVNDDNGSFWAKAGTPCDGQGEGAANDSKLAMQKQKLKDIVTTLAAGCNQSEIRDAQRYARMAIQEMDKAKAMQE